jgi:hypothetical protein
MTAVFSETTRVIKSMSAVISAAEALLGTKAFKNQNIKL